MILPFLFLKTLFQLIPGDNLKPRVLLSQNGYHSTKDRKKEPKRTSNKELLILPVFSEVILSEHVKQRLWQMSFKRTI